MTCVAPAPTGSSGVASTSWPAITRRRSSPNSPAVWYRFAGFFASDRITTASSGGGTSGFSVEGGTGVSCTCLYATAIAESPVNGGAPARISYSTTPSE